MNHVFLFHKQTKNAKLWSQFLEHTKKERLSRDLTRARRAIQSPAKFNSIRHRVKAFFLSTLAERKSFIVCIIFIFYDLPTIFESSSHPFMKFQRTVKFEDSMGLFLLVTTAFWTGHSVARYVRSLASLTPLTRSLRSRARSLTSLTPSWDGWNSWICIHAEIVFHGNNRDSCRY